MYYISIISKLNPPLPSLTKRQEAWCRYERRTMMLNPRGPTRRN